MNDAIPNVSFDGSGICNYCRTFDILHRRKPRTSQESERRLESLASRIRASGRGQPYDSVLGISGGVDSAYALHTAHRLGLRPLVVHFDNGWNSPQAVRNIRKLVEKCGLDLHTYIVDWLEFRDVQRSLLKASVIDVELVTDHAFFALLFRVARQHGIRYSIVGNNDATESFMPPGWNWNKYDLRNLQAIQRRWGERPLRSIPTLGFWTRLLCEKLGFLCQSVYVLNHLVYRQDEAIKLLSETYGYEYCGGKHYESTFTKFYQAYILPRKFHVDKRRVHYSSLICNQEMTRAQALAQLAKDPYEPEELRRDLPFVLKKLQFSQAEFSEIMNSPSVSHSAYASDHKFFVILQKLKRWLSRWPS